MNILKKIFNVVGLATTKDLAGVEKASKGEIAELEDYSRSYRKPKKPLSFKEMQEFYEKNEWVRSCVDQIVKTAAKVKPYVAPIEESEEIPEETKRHIEEVEELLANPNSKDESFTSLRRKILRDILVYDAGALEIVYDNTGKPVELYDLPGYLIRLSVDKHGDFKDPEEKAYCQLPVARYDEKLIWFAQEEVIYFAANPQSGSVYGLSPLESLVYTIEADLNAAEYNAAFFKNNAEPSGIINIEGLSPRALKRWKTYWKREFKGPKKAHRMLATSGKNVNFTKISESQKDMQFMEYQKWLLQKILTVYNVKPFVLGIVDATTGKLNSAEQWTMFKEAAIDPLLSLEAYLYTTKLINVGFGYDDIELRFEEVDIKDEKQTADIVEKLAKAGIMSVNEIRRIYYGLENVGWGDTPLGLNSPSIFPTEETKSVELEEEKEESLNPRPLTTPETNLSQIADKIREILSRRKE